MQKSHNLQILVKHAKTYKDCQPFSRKDTGNDKCNLNRNCINIWLPRTLRNWIQIRVFCDNEREIWEREEYVSRCGNYGIVGIWQNVIRNASVWLAKSHSGFFSQISAELVWRFLPKSKVLSNSQNLKLKYFASWFHEKWSLHPFISK